ncbi:hypothetical protein [endosymbiont GvMRE of Glomus versiforme]|uniref:hypothetical protein n=1 Tax=endosymbiont GvMRE of Glomus versiforme TaxID=2039283 RepID=UPI000EC233C6|nr:hypothetical protein [endosymbiont GvMRE of Glomus versiforme]RHZ35642.1 hypothetical protein GvMRE_IIg36 [endosymbiont GvMRE of Glomus versiforme]
MTKKCQYHYPNCQKQATYQHLVKLGSVTIDKGWACSNCKQAIEKARKKKPATKPSNEK